MSIKQLEIKLNEAIISGNVNLVKFYTDAINNLKEVKKEMTVDNNKINAQELYDELKATVPLFESLPISKKLASYITQQTTLEAKVVDYLTETSELSKIEPLQHVNEGITITHPDYQSQLDKVKATRLWLFNWTNK